jgi:hypothetical protein
LPIPKAWPPEERECIFRGSTGVDLRIEILGFSKWVRQITRFANFFVRFFKRFSSFSPLFPLLSPLPSPLPSPLSPLPYPLYPLPSTLSPLPSPLSSLLSPLSSLTPLLLKKNTTKIFFSVLVVLSLPFFLGNLVRIVQAAGGKPVKRVGYFSTKTIDVRLPSLLPPSPLGPPSLADPSQLVISSDPPGETAENLARENAIPIFTQTWLHDCLILQKFITDTENPVYLYNSGVPITSYLRLRDFWPPGAEHTCLLEECPCRKPAPPATPKRGARGGKPIAATPVKGKEKEKEEKSGKGGKATAEVKGKEKEIEQVEEKAVSGKGKEKEKSRKAGTKKGTATPARTPGQKRKRGTEGPKVTPSKRGRK